jgi:RNA polymerase sigma factor (sigma-70 family)
VVADFELLERWVAGDDAAARELVHRHFSAVFAFFRSKTSTDVEDLVQETFAACVEGRDRFRRDATFRAYLFGIARNKILRYYRDRRELDTLSDVAESRLVDLDPTPSRVLAGKREERLLLEALRQLPIDHQVVIELYCWEELSGPEVAEVLGITEPAMRSRLHRAKRELRSLIERLASAPDLLQSTLANLDSWAASLRRAAS